MVCKKKKKSESVKIKIETEVLAKNVLSVSRLNVRMGC